MKLTVYEPFFLLFSGDGRSLSKEEWMQMKGDVAKLKADLDQVDVVSEAAPGAAPEAAPAINV
jgi:hypothetical protein